MAKLDSPVKICKDCKYFGNNSECLKSPTLNVVTGSVKYPSCYLFRAFDNDDDCGPSAKFFERKQQ